MIKTKQIITLLLVTGMLCCIAALFVGCSKRVEINFNDYVTIEESGYDGYGAIDIQIDYQTLINQRVQALELTADKKQELITIFDYYKRFKPTYEESDVLKNGDKITIKWELDSKAVKTLEEKMGVNFNTDALEYTMSKLIALQEYDPFEHLTINTNNSISGLGSLDFVINTTINDKNVVWEVAHDGENGKLSNGDVINLKIVTEIDEDTFARSTGCKLKMKETQYTITVLGEYAVSEKIISAIDRTQLSILNKVMDEWVVSGLNDENPNAQYRTYTNVGFIYYTNNLIEVDVNNITPSTFVAIYHVNDGFVENGYYVFLALTDTFVLPYEGGVCLEDGSALPDAFVFYDKETVRYSETFGWRQGDEKMGFLHDGIAYAGHQDLQNILTYIDELYNNKYQFKFADPELPQGE